MYNLLVTGSNGFLGKNVVDHLKKNRDQYNRICLISRNQSPIKDFECFKCDISEPFEIPFKADIIFHLAAQANPMQGDVFFDNLLMTKNVLDYAKKCNSSITYTSSNSIFGNMSVAQFERPTSLYGASKSACEKLIMAHCHQYDVKACIFNLSAVVGKHTTHGAFHSLTRKCKEEKVIVAIGRQPGSCKPYVWAKDAVEIIVEETLYNNNICRRHPHYRNIHPLNSISIDRLIELIQKRFGTNKKVVWTNETYIGDNLYVYPCPDQELEMKTSQEYVELALAELED